MGIAAVRARLRRPLGSDESGITLIETVAALAIFALVGAALAGLLTSSISANSFARQKSLGEQIANDQMEWIRSHSYDDIGDGNPPGMIATTGLKCENPTNALCDANPVSLRGLAANVSTAIAYVDDPAPTSYSPYANYKQLTVTVRRASDSKILTQIVSYQAPPSRAPFGGLNNGIIVPTVEDQFEADPLLRRIPNVTVTLTSSSPLVNRPDDTDSNGTITFAALTPNPTSTNYYELRVAPPSGYVVLKSHDIDKTPTSTYARHSLAPGENWPTILRVYRPSTIFLNLTDSQSGTLYTGSTTVQLAAQSFPGYTQSYACPGSLAGVYSCTGGQLTVWKIASEPLVKDTYTVSASGPFVVSPTTINVPNAYPSDLTFTQPLPGVLIGTMSVTVTANGSPLSGATVTVTGGPQSVNLTATTGGSGVVSFPGLAAGSGYVVTATKNGVGASNPNVTVIAGTTTNVPLNLLIGNIPITVRWGPGGPVVPNASVTVTGPGGFNQTLTTDASGQATVVDVASGPGYNVSATKAGFFGGPVSATASTPGTNVDVPLPAVGTIQTTVTWAAQPAAGSTVTLVGGPDAKTYTGTTNASGVASIAVPPTTASFPYTVSAVKAGSATVTAANVTSLASGATVTRAIALTPTKTLTLTIKAGPSTGTNIPNQPVTVSLTGPPNGVQNAAPAYQFSGNTTGSSTVVLTVPTAVSGTSTYRVKVYRGTGACSGSTANARINTTLNVTAGAGSQSANIVLTSNTCPTLP